MDKEKTELEKRWEEEEAEEGDAACQEDGDGQFQEFIMNPLNPEEVLVVAFVGPRALIGGLKGFDDKQLVLSLPVIYAEEAAKGPQGQINRRPVIARIMNFAGIPDSMIVNPEFFHFLSNNVGKNMDLAAAYETVVKGFLAQDAGIMMPTEAEVHDLHRQKLVK